MTKILKNFTILLIIGLNIFSIGCKQSADKKYFHEEIAKINTQIQQDLQQINQLPYYGDVTGFSNKAKMLLVSIDNHIQQYHLLMDRTNQLIDKEARARIIGFKQKKAEIEFKLALLENGGAYTRYRNTLSYSDTVITIRNASGTAVTHDIEQLETNETEVELRKDTTLLLLRLEEWKYDGINLRNELLNDFQEVKKEIESFRKRNL